MGGRGKSAPRSAPPSASGTQASAAAEVDPLASAFTASETGANPFDIPDPMKSDDEPERPQTEQVIGSVDALNEILTPQSGAVPILSDGASVIAAVQPHLDPLGATWQIIESASADDPPDGSRFGLIEPTLRWQSDGKVRNLFVAGMNTAQFLTANGLAMGTNEHGGWQLHTITAETFANVGIINQETALGGAVYPFLEQTGRAWTVFTHDLEQPACYPHPCSFGMVKPTLRYVKDGKIEDVFVDGMTTEQFLAKTGLSLGMDKGGFVLSKRLSRIMRPYFASASFPHESVSIRYLDQTSNEQKLWDGAGLISRKMLERLMIPDGAPPAKRAELLREIAQCQRIEFTVMTERGQDKGHAIVSDDLDADFVLPRDTKKEVKLINSQTWVGVNFVHAHDEMRIDIQSLINLHPFFDEVQYTQWLDDEGKLFTYAVESGQVGQAMSRIDPFATLDDVEAWHLREYFASGGHAMWSPSIVRNLMNQHLKRLNETTLERMRLPMPGGRYYVMPVSVGKAAGMDHDVPRGHVRIDADYATAWVNDDDWLAMHNSPTGKGIRDILGGADNDDALWVHPFTDHDGEQKMLCWRSPNQAGEYVVLKPTIGSRVLAWNTVDGEVTFPPADSRKLFARADTVAQNYLDLIDPNTASGLGKGQPYSIEVMDETIRRAKANAGGLGMYCNMLMLSKALYGGLPKNPPAPLEDFIDSTVKTGADVSRGRQWCYDASQAIIASGRAVPSLLVGRLAASRRDKANVPLTSDHWLDRLQGAVKAHIETFRGQRSELAERAMPPAQLFDHAFNSEERNWLDTGAALNSLYRTVRGKRLHGKRTGERLDDTDMDAIRTAIDHYLSRFDARDHGAILRGALVTAA